MNNFNIRSIVCIALGTLFLQALPSRAEDYTDIWWNAPARSEDGWGVNLVQSQDTIFATFFVHGPAPSKTEFWYVATLARTGSSFSGDLYQTTGTGIGAPWSAADHTVTKVGTATFTPTSSTTGTLNYNVGSVVVNKNITRQTLTSIALGGSYYGTIVLTSSGCAGAGSNPYNFDPVINQTVGGQMQISFTLSDFTPPDSCTIQGTYVQEGTLFRIPAATYACTSGINTPATVYELKATSLGLEGRWSADNVGASRCHEDAVFSAVFP